MDAVEADAVVAPSTAVADPHAERNPKAGPGDKPSASTGWGALSRFSVQPGTSCGLGIRALRTAQASGLLLSWGCAGERWSGYV